MLTQRKEADMTQTHSLFRATLVILSGLMISACSVMPNQPRLGMVVDQKTGLMFGSAIENNLVTDATFYSNRTLKVRTRNTSGDSSFGLNDFKGDLRTAYSDKGYEPISDGEPFGLLININVMYSGQIQTNQPYTFSLPGALLTSTYSLDTASG